MVAIMKNKICCNILDCDGVLVPGEELMDNYILPVCEEATNIYCEKLYKQQTELIILRQQLEQDRNIYGKEMIEINDELNGIEKKLKRHFDLKDQFLEETEDKYRNIINYDEIYQRENVYPGILDLTWEIYDKKIYGLQICCSHINSEGEIIAKSGLFKKEFPPIKFVPVRYHIVPYRTNGLINKNREPSDKLGRLVRAMPSIDTVTSPVTDNSKSIILRGNELGMRSYFVAKGQNPVLIIMQAANDTIDLVHKGKIKKLSR